MNMLLHEGGAPSVREVIGGLLGAATHADLAVSHVRLDAVELRSDETTRLTRCRFLLQRLDASAVTDFGAGAGNDRLRALFDFVASGRVEVRSAGLAAWLPDFSVFRGLTGTRSGMLSSIVCHGHRDAGTGLSGTLCGTSASRPRDACLVGAHYFRQPPTADGPALTSLITEPRSVALAQQRFNELWPRGHDVTTVVLDALERKLGQPR
jgi:hypothetical protein